MDNKQVRELLVREFAEAMSAISMELLQTGEHALVGHMFHVAMNKPVDDMPASVEEFASMAADGFEVAP